MPLSLIGGKFYNEHNQVVPPEFGNKEMIKLIQDRQREIEEEKEMEAMVKAGEIVLATIRKFDAHFALEGKCCCGRFIQTQKSRLEYDDELIMMDETLHCSCGRHWYVAGTFNDKMVLEFMGTTPVKL